jgi:CheY-like chemotaxis protein
MTGAAGRDGDGHRHAGMNGYEAARRIREGPPAAAGADRADRLGPVRRQGARAQAGIDHHFVKPLQVDELLGCLSRLAAARPAEPVQA